MKNDLYLHYLVLRKKSNEFVGSDKTPNKVIDLVELDQKNVKISLIVRFLVHFFP